jgi:hypothetical protein
MICAAPAGASRAARAGERRGLTEAIHSSRGVVVDLGTAQVGCGIAPDQVLADLFKTKQPCPPGEGIG